MNAEPIKILVVDDDAAVLNVVEHNLKQAGYGVVLADDGQSGLRQMHEHKPDLVLLDLNLPDIDGFEICDRIREASDVPIVMLTAIKDPEDQVRGLDMGADDYVVKPFDMPVLLARIRASLRRMQAAKPMDRESFQYSDQYLTIRLSERRILRDGQPIKLTRTEFDLLTQLLMVAPETATYRTLLENVWGHEFINDIDYLRVYIWHLRGKIEPDSKHPRYIINEQGVGYRFETRHGDNVK